ncbi:MAG: T9SS type A sorting domain-containing protein [Crocinitomicaceae bacterium]|nr:T9SS type A sorting domain-containing protein [Crocinitomicaceae bacterium]MDP4868483.1 T9SS type A sorting domain-containing protein [Crocinitomicaceae bacterium]
MKRNKTILALLFGSMQFAAFAQNNYVYGVMRTPGQGTNVAAGTIRLGKLDVSSGALTSVSPNSLASVISATGAALDPVTQTYFFQTQTDFVSVNMLDGLPSAQNAMSNPIAPSYFDNYRFNTSDSTIYGLARRSTTIAPGQVNGELYLATIDPNTGVITQISPQSVGQMYAVQGCAINPHEMVYYYSNQGKIIGLDLYNGQVYSEQTITFPEGGLYFDNYTYNCADTSIYGIIRATTTIPIECYLGKIDPQTGVATRVSQQPLPYNSYTINGSSTIDPINGVYYFSGLLPQGGYAVVGVSVTTGLVVFEQLITPLGAASNSLYFDLLRHPGDCFEATPTRVNPNGGSAGLAGASKSTLKVAPNPFEQQFTVSSAELIQALTLRDAQGKVVLQQEANSNKLDVQTAALQSGVYFLEVQTASGLELVKLVK